MIDKYDAMKVYTYLIYFEPIDIYKVGITTDVNKRVSDIMRGLNVKSDLVCVFTQDIEKYILSVYESDRLQGRNKINSEYLRLDWTKLGQIEDNFRHIIADGFRESFYEHIDKKWRMAGNSRQDLLLKIEGIFSNPEITQNDEQEFIEFLLNLKKASQKVSSFGNA